MTRSFWDWRPCRTALVADAASPSVVLGAFGFRSVSESGFDNVLRSLHFLRLIRPLAFGSAGFGCWL
jgi:hypothetical protein